MLLVVGNPVLHMEPAVDWKSHRSWNSLLLSVYPTACCTVLQETCSGFVFVNEVAYAFPGWLGLVVVCIDRQKELYCETVST